MGIPGYFKWLTNRYHYPDIIQDCIEHNQYDENGVFYPLDETQPNLHGFEFDNLYLDMNGIIHAAMKKENNSTSNIEDKLFHSIFDAIDEIFALVRPRKLLFIAIDGVSPLAKFHQKRTKRYLESKEILDKTKEIKIIKSKILASGNVLPTSIDQNESFDEECITSGTSFMIHLSNCLRYYIYNRMNTKPAWQSLKVICSDANVPGEGEHKIMNFIRQQSNDEKTKHVLFGTDADLIILGLSVHIENISIMRNKMNLTAQYPCELCREQGHDYKKCQGISKEHQNILQYTSTHEKNKYIFVHLSKLRERLHDYFCEYCDFSFPWNFERFIDDWIFLCFLNGNDFLPDIPSFEIYQNSIDDLLTIYIANVPFHNDYLTNNGQLNLTLFEIILTQFGQNENYIFNERFQISQQWQIKKDELNKQQIKSTINLEEVITNNKKELPSFRPTYGSKKVDSSLNNPTTTMNNSDYTVKLWENDWHNQYYQKKFQIDSNQVQNQQKSIVQSYIQGLCWILDYYYHGVPSWNWYYPYHYAPFASDFINLDIDECSYTNSKAFTPLEQLICMTSSNYVKYLPEQWQTQILIDFPSINDYDLPYSIIDSNGKRYQSQYTVRLPFVDEKLVHDFMTKHEQLLTIEEKQRNEETKDLLFFHSNCLENNIKNKKNNKNPLEIFQQLNIPGQVWTDINDDKIISIGQSVNSPLNNYNSIPNNQIFCMKYYT